jgi:hypothetical protein
MMRHRDRVVYFVVSLYQDYAIFCVKTIYCCLKTMNFHLFISCCLDCYILFLMYAYFGGSSSGKAAKTGII